MAFDQERWFAQVAAAAVAHAQQNGARRNQGWCLYPRLVDVIEEHHQRPQKGRKTEYGYIGGQPFYVHKQILWSDCWILHDGVIRSRRNETWESLGSGAGESTEWGQFHPISSDELQNFVRGRQPPVSGQKRDRGSGLTITRDVWRWNKGTPNSWDLLNKIGALIEPTAIPGYPTQADRAAHKAQDRQAADQRRAQRRALRRAKRRQRKALGEQAQRHATPLVLPTPGWFSCPWHAETLRWWNGRQWTHHTHPKHP